MLVMVLSGLLLLVGIVSVVVWGDDTVRPPEFDDAAGPDSVALAARR